MPPSVWLTNDISPVERSLMKTSYSLLLSPAPLTKSARLDDVLSNAIFVPSKLNIALFEYPFPMSPSFDVLAMDISPVNKFFTKSWGPELPPATRFVEPLVKATRLPSGETLSDVPYCPAWSPITPSMDTSTLWCVPVSIFLTWMPSWPLLTATTAPSAEMLNWYPPLFDEPEDQSSTSFSSPVVRFFW